MGKVVDKLRCIRDLGITLIVVHHSGKDATKGMRGHNSLLAAADNVFVFKKKANSNLITMKREACRNGPTGDVFDFEIKTEAFKSKKDKKEFLVPYLSYIEGFSDAKKENANVPYAHKVNEFNLGKWVQYQRQRKNLTSLQVKKLNDLDFIWDSDEHKWTKGFKQLKKHMHREGHCKVPQNTIENGFKLGKWVDKQRLRRSNLTSSQIKDLDTLNFVWSVRDQQWENGYKHLQMFKSREGHCKVTINTLEDNFKLGNWVKVQRRSKATLSSEKINKLNSLDFIWKLK